MELVKKPYPGLLAIAIALFVLSAAAFYSKQGDGAGIPILLLAFFLLSTYFASRRGTITFTLDSGATEVVTGSIKDAASLSSAIESAIEAQEVEVPVRSRAAAV